MAINILALKPGEALDELVAIHVMRWHKIEAGRDVERYGAMRYAWAEEGKDFAVAHCQDFMFAKAWSPSENMEAAWEIVERLTEHQYLKVRCESSMYHGDYCTITAPDKSQMPEGIVLRDAKCWGETMPHAICLAALMATYTSGPDEDVIG